MMATRKSGQPRRLKRLPTAILPRMHQGRGLAGLPGLSFRKHLSHSDHRSARHPDIGRMLATRRVHKLRHGIENRLGFETREVECGQIGCFSCLDRADTPLQPQRPGSPESSGLECHRRRQGARVAPDALCEQGGEPEFRAPCRGGRCWRRRRCRCPRSRQRRAAPRPARCRCRASGWTPGSAPPTRRAAASRAISSGSRCTACTAISRSVTRRRRSRRARGRSPCSRNRLLDLVRGLVQVHVHRQVEFLGEHRDAPQGVVAHRVGRMRRQREGHQGVVAKPVARRETLAQVVLGVRPRTPSGTRSR